ncbi:hypothetical protein F0562_008643 [Nyssa sinensis]|uniref:GPI-anchored protein LLG1-like domain-containing protein n=1 Tax=Nyssa sinensis TaxID=561372 RepID=A0A5J5AAR6_9ASTE|nr:hypothetical protein F0562_008643 [Nyssa sinensis]
MKWNRSYCSSSAILFLFLFLFTRLSAGSASASAFISDCIFGLRASTSRNLLQAKKACPVNFEFLNYTIFTTRCKGPQYPPNACCPAFKEFACPYADVLNDLTNDCATTMFSYINLHGKYPPGLFASVCREGKDGLSCKAESPTATELANSNNGSQIVNPSLLLVLSVGFLVLLLWWF